VAGSHDPQDDHHCHWREIAEALAPKVAANEAESAELRAKLEAMAAAMQALERRLLGPKTEKMPPADEEIEREKKKTRTKEDAEARRLETLRKRRERAALREKLRQQTVTHHVAEPDKKCTRCGKVANRPVGDGKETVIFEYIPGYFVRQKHIQEKLACTCGEFIATADPPRKPFEGGHYGAGFVAHLIVMKCGDSIPLHRLAKQYQRLGIPMARSTITDQFHAGATKLAPLSQRLLNLVARSDIVQGDETSMMMQRPHKRGFLWTFLAERLIAYRFSPDRSGETPRDVLGGTQGTLVVDAYTGYNRVTDPEGRARASCLAHVRRRIFEALESAPIEARRGLELILDVYRVEHEAKEQGIVRTAEHLALRQTKGRAAMEAFQAWLAAEKDRHPPKSPLGQAISYALNRGETLTRFLDDVRIPVDNNAAERALRVVALGRKNFLFVGDPEAGNNLAGLYSLVSTCEAYEIDPVAYLADVLLRIDTHPASQIDELLPHRWVPPTVVEIS
jgi:transposase